MKLAKTALIGVLFVVIGACQESIEDRAAREVVEHTMKTCPLEIAPGLTNDSITFDRKTRTVQYHFTMHGDIDGARVDTVAARARLRRLVDNATNLRAYKDAGFVFRYTYYSEGDGRRVLDFTIDDKKDGNR